MHGLVKAYFDFFVQKSQNLENSSNHKKQENKIAYSIQIKNIFPSFEILFQVSNKSALRIADLLRICD